MFVETEGIEVPLDDVVIVLFVRTKESVDGREVVRSPLEEHLEGRCAVYVDGFSDGGTDQILSITNLSTDSRVSRRARSATQARM